MDLDEKQLRIVPKGGTLYTLDNGIRIVRRPKHEPIDVDGLDAARLKWKTDKNNGSKFLKGISLKRIVEMTEEVLRENRAVPEVRSAYNKVYAVPIGISEGKKVRAIRVDVGGGWAHGYPVNEDEL